MGSLDTGKGRNGAMGGEGVGGQGADAEDSPFSCFPGGSHIHMHIGCHKGALLKL